MTDSKPQAHPAPDPQHSALEQRGGTLPPASASMRRDERYTGESREIVVVNQGTLLTADQKHTSQQLRQLYQSLCGNQPGQYWPQALLDTAGRFNRPNFPGQEQYKSGRGRT